MCRSSSRASAPSSAVSTACCARSRRTGSFRSEWDAEEPGPAKRRYELTPAGRELLRAWAKALKQTQQVVDAFLKRHEGR